MDKNNIIKNGVVYLCLKARDEKIESQMLKRFNLMFLFLNKNIILNLKLKIVQILKVYI